MHHQIHLHAHEWYMATEGSPMLLLDVLSVLSEKSGRPWTYIVKEAHHHDAQCAQLGLNSPFKSGADYWREGSEDPSQGNGHPAGRNARLPPVGDLFNFKAPSDADKLGSVASEDAALPGMPAWLADRPFLTGQHFMQVCIETLCVA